MPILNLINKCHEVISSNESQIFQGNEERKGDPAAAIDQLYRADMVNIVYDPDGSKMQKDLNLGQEDEDMKEENEVLQQPQLTFKSKSVQLPFKNLGHDSSR